MQKIAATEAEVATNKRGGILNKSPLNIIQQYNLGEVMRINWLIIINLYVTFHRILDIASRLSYSKRKIVQDDLEPNRCGCILDRFLAPTITICLSELVIYEDFI